MKRRWLFLFVAALGAGAPVLAAAETAARRWNHPVHEYPRSSRRWFVTLPAALEYSEVRCQAGDDPRWAQPDWDDAGWEVRGFWELPARAGLHWVRFRVRMGENGQATMPAGIMISTARAYEIFWDGVQLGTNGVPGMSREAEKVGRVDDWFSVPGALRGPGEHVVALRTSSFRVGFPASTSGFRFLVDTPARLQGMVLREAFVPTLAAGALCMVALAALMMWVLAARRASLVLLGGVCLAGAAMQALQAFRWFYPYPADWHYPILTTMVTLVGVQVVLMVALVIALFELPRRRLLLGGMVPVLAAVSWLSPERMNLEGVWMLVVGMAAALVCAAWAVRRRRRGAWLAVAGVATSALLLALEAEDFRASFFLKFLPALLGLIGALAMQLHEERRQAQAAQLASARLEIELLKKNIQPHFLLNTLATVAELVERDPPGAVKFIDDLATEFRSLALISGERLVPLQRELELCHAHLKVISRRTGREVGLDAAGVDLAALVPPAVFLTLIENGLVHQQPNGQPVFRLRAATTGAGARYIFLSRGEARPLAGRPAGGTGIRYVKARLEESFPDRWRFAHQRTAEGWETIIDLGAGEKTGARRA